jgi:hypothetical protein
MATLKRLVMSIYNSSSSRAREKKCLRTSGRTSAYAERDLSLRTCRNWERKRVIGGGELSVFGVNAQRRMFRMLYLDPGCFNAREAQMSPKGRRVNTSLHPWNMGQRD